MVFCLLTLKAESFRTPSARGFISFAGPKETNQRKGPSSTRLTGRFTVAGIFRHGIHAVPKNGAHPCAPPSGSPDMVGTSRSSKARSPEKHPSPSSRLKAEALQQPNGGSSSQPRRLGRLFDGPRTRASSSQASALRRAELARLLFSMRAPGTKAAEQAPLYGP